MTGKTVVIVESNKSGVLIHNVEVTIEGKTAFRQVVCINDKWFAVNPWILSGGSREYHSKEAAIAAAANLEI